MKCGEVWSVQLPTTSGGHEQSGTRPAVVLQDETYAEKSPLVLIVPLTSQLAALRFPATVKIESSPENGLTLPSIAMVFQMRSLDRARFARLLGALYETDMARVLLELNKLTGQAE